MGYIWRLILVSGIFAFIRLHTFELDSWSIILVVAVIFSFISYPQSKPSKVNKIIDKWYNKFKIYFLVFVSLISLFWLGFVFTLLPMKMHRHDSFGENKVIVRQYGDKMIVMAMNEDRRLIKDQYWVYYKKDLDASQPYVPIIIKGR